MIEIDHDIDYFIFIAQISRASWKQSTGPIWPAGQDLRNVVYKRHCRLLIDLDDYLFAKNLQAWVNVFNTSFKASLSMKAVPRMSPLLTSPGVAGVDDIIPCRHHHELSKLYYSIVTLPIRVKTATPKHCKTCVNDVTVRSGGRDELGALRHC